MKFGSVVVGLVLALDASCSAAFGGVPQWISGNTKAPEKPAPVIYRDFRLDTLPSHAEITLAVAGWHELSVNGRPVADAVLSPVTCQPNLRISSVTRDITKLLRTGENRIEVLLGNGWFNCFTKEVWGFSSAPWQDAPMIRGSLLVDGRTLLETDGTWRACDSPIVFNALRNGEWYDARKEGLREHDRPATVVKYPPYAEVSPEDAAPCRAFDPIPPVRSFAAGDGGTIYDFGSNRSGWCEIEVSGEAGAKVTLDYDEALTPSNTLCRNVVMFQRRAKEPRPCQHDEYVLAGRADGERWHPRFTYHGFRYAQVRTTGRVELKAIRSVFVHSDFAEKGAFSISDPVFAKLLDATRRSYFSNFVGIPTDCPHREKNGWTGDTQLAMETGMWNFDGSASYLHFLRMMLDAQRRNGAVPCIIPCTESFGFLWGSGPAWDAILFEIPWQMFRFTGDDASAREAFPAMKRYLGFIDGKADDEGLVDYGLGDWCPPKGLKSAPVRLTDSAYVHEFNRRTAFWADRFGDAETAARCRARAKAIRAAFNRAFYRGNGVYDEGQPTALAAALYFPGLCADGEADKVAAELVRRIRAGGHKAAFGILGAKWVPRVLSDHGYIEDAWRLFVQPEYPGWARWMSKTDTLWELWEDTTTSFNHVMFGDLSAWAFEYLAGIKIVEAGFRKVDIKPYLPEGVAGFSATYATPKGKIRVSARRENGRPVYEHELPAPIALPSPIAFPDAPFAMPALKEPAFPKQDFAITDYGARPGEKCTAAFAAAMEACEKAGGGHVVVPKGRWLTGAVRFRNDCDLHFEEGAVLESTDDPADYPAVHTSWEGIECINHSPLIYAYGVTNVAITGRGLIEPRMRLWSERWAGYDPQQMAATRELYMWGSTNAAMKARRLLDLDGAKARPHLIQFNRTANVLLDGFRINGSPFWMIHLYHSENCIVRNLSTYGRGLNNDGLDIEMTRNVLVENCRFDQGDDGIVLKAGRNADAWRLNRPTENVVIRNCDLASSHSLLGIGSELSGGIRNVWVTGCKVEQAFNLFNIKTGRRRGGFVNGVWVEDCTGDDVGSVFNITTVYKAQYTKFPDFEIRYTDIGDIHVRNVRCNRVRTGVRLHGDAHLPPHDIEIGNVSVGEAIEGLSEVTDCRDVRIDGLVLGRPDPNCRRTMEDELDKADSIAALSPDHAKAIAFLRRPDLASLPLGRHEIDGDRVVAEISEVETTYFSPTDKKPVRDDGHDLIYFIVDGEEEMFEVGESFAFHWVWRPLVFMVPAGMVHSPHHTNKGPKRIRVCVVKVR